MNITLSTRTQAWNVNALNYRLSLILFPPLGWTPCYWNLKQHFYESGDKAGKLLACQTRAEATSRLIQEVKAATGEVLSDPKVINSTFAEFYTSLYTSDHPHSPNSTLDKIDFPQIAGDKAEMLGAPVTTAEVQEAIKLLQSGKSPGPDSFTAEYYKTISNLLTPHLTDMYNEAFA